MTVPADADGPALVRCPHCGLYATADGTPGGIHQHDCPLFDPNHNNT